MRDGKQKAVIFFNLTEREYVCSQLVSAIAATGVLDGAPQVIRIER